MILQLILGLDTLHTSSQIIAWNHFDNAIVIYGAAMSGTFVAARVVQMGKIQPTVAR